MVSSEVLRTFKSLHEFVTTSVQHCIAVENETPQQHLNLVTFLEAMKDKTWRDIKAVLFTQVCPHLKDDQTFRPLIIGHWYLRRRRSAGQSRLTIPRVQQLIERPLNLPS
jgi:hypothetical protein